MGQSLISGSLNRLPHSSCPPLHFPSSSSIQRRLPPPRRSVGLCVKIRRCGIARSVRGERAQSTGPSRAGDEPGTSPPARGARQASMGGSAIDGLIFADFRATNPPLFVQISRRSFRLSAGPSLTTSPRSVGDGGRQ